MKPTMRLKLGIVFVGSYDETGCDIDRCLNADEVDILRGLERWNNPAIEYFYGYNGFDESNKPDLISFTFWNMNSDGSVEWCGDKNGVEIETEVGDTEVTSISANPQQYLKSKLWQVRDDIKTFCSNKFNAEVEFV